MNTVPCNASDPDSALTLAQKVDRYRQEHADHWDRIAQETEKTGPGLGAYYHQRLGDVYRLLIPENKRVLELGSGRGDLLAHLQPSVGVGVDFSPQMIALAKARHPSLTWMCADAHVSSWVEELAREEPGTFDFVIVSDLVNELYDVQQVLEQIRPLCGTHTRIICNTYSRLWELPLELASKMKLARPMLRQNWLTVSDTANLLHLAGFETLRSWQEVLWPVRTPGLDTLCNRFLVNLWPMRHLAMSNFLIARPSLASDQEMTGHRGTCEKTSQGEGEPVVSVIVAARNEAGNIEQIIERTPQMGAGTELIFVEGGSHDQTYEAIEQAIVRHPDWGAGGIQLMRQDGKGKGDAVRKGFAHATGGVLMILDADMTVPPEDLPRFYHALRSGAGEYINGVRLVYPMEDQAMRFFNLLGNKFFSLAFSWLLGQPIKDTLCGTKVMTADNYRQLAANRHYFGDFDPFGDFDLIFGAAKMNLKMVDLPIRYQARTYGTTNIARWRSGVILLRMTLYAARRLKFV